MDRTIARMPRIDVVLRTVGALQQHAIVSAIGGSGLLAGLGLTDAVRDWDLTTDAEPEAVAGALTSASLNHVQVTAGDGDYATRARFSVEGGDHEVDLLVGFAFRSAGSTIPLPTRVTQHWRGLPLGDPIVWAHAYQLMGRSERAATLQAWLAESGFSESGSSESDSDESGSGESGSGRRLARD
jgi:hypothetical protein